MLSCIAGSERPLSTMFRLCVMVRKCSRIRSARQLGNVAEPDGDCALDSASSTAEGASKVRTLSTSRAASCKVPRSRGRSQLRGTFTPPGAGEPNGRGGTANGAGRAMVGCPGRSGIFAVKSLYVTDQRAPFGPMPSCRTVLPFGAGSPANPGGSTFGGGAAAPSVDAGLGAAPSVGCVDVGVSAAGVVTGAPRWASACAICCCIWGGSGMAPTGPSGLSGCCT
jgi:hypothetical protein